MIGATPIPEAQTKGTIRTFTYTEDLNGNITTKTQPNGTTHTYTYDAENRLIKQRYKMGKRQEKSAMHMIHSAGGYQRQYKGT